LTAVLDEGVPVRLVKALAEVGCRAVGFPKHWKGLKNGALLEEVRRSGHSCIVTCDKNFRHQQNIVQSDLALVVLPRQRFQELRPIVQAIADAVDRAGRGDVLVLTSDGSIREPR
jgi:hypothetical protein